MTEADTTPGSQSALRQANERRIVDVLRREGTSTQAELARATGLSAASVSNIVRGLRASGTVTARATSSNGRRARAVTLVRPPGTVVGVDFAADRLRVAVADHEGGLLERESIDYDVAADPGRAVRRAAWLTETVLFRGRIDLASVASVVASVPGPLDSATGAVGAVSCLPRWTGFRPAPALQERLGRPVRAENDANLAALAERRRGAARGARTVIHLHLGEGVGSGLVLDGRLLRGADGTAGEIGHIGLDPRGQVCRCGNRGCLETFVGTSYLLAMVPRDSGLARDGSAALQQLVAAAHGGDPAGRRILSEAGTALGQGTAVVANLLNPDRVVVGGPLAAAGDLLLDPMVRAMALGTLGSALERVQVVPGELGEYAVLHGAILTAAETPA